MELYGSTNISSNIFNINTNQYIYIANLLSATATLSYQQIISSHYLNISKKLILEVMDQKWTEYGERISLSRDTIGLQAYAQRDPIIEYSRLCSQEFSELIKDTQSLIITSLINFSELNKTYLGV